MKISLITVTFNSGGTLRDTIQSVLSQTYYDIEYIIVDGHSQDNTVDIIKEYEPLFDGRLKWISEKDQGLYDAMNKGFQMATGDMVGIINSDDLLAALESAAFIRDYNLRMGMYGLEGIKIRGFRGEIVMQFKRNLVMQRILSLLTYYSQFTGLGIKTALGMGGVQSEVVQ